jgi:large subunit ribosomal protein L35
LKQKIVSKLNLNKLGIMPKMKTKSSAKKRFKVTGSGKIKRKHAFKSHILTKKSKKRKLALTHSALVHKTDMKSIKQQLRII